MSSNSYTHSFQKTFLHYFSLHTHFISSLSHTHTRSLRLPPSSLRYHHCYTTPLGNWGFSSQSWVHMRAAIRRRCLLLSVSLYHTLSVSPGLRWILRDSPFISIQKHRESNPIHMQLFLLDLPDFASYLWCFCRNVCICWRYRPKGCTCKNDVSVSPILTPLNWPVFSYLLLTSFFQLLVTVTALKFPCVRLRLW